jgi:hypothetical protein
VYSIRANLSIKESKMKAIQKAVALASLATIVGCSSAPKATEVSAAYVPAGFYTNMTCDQLIAEAEAVRRSVPALENAVNTHRSNQTGVEVVTWVLFWPAAFFLDKGEATSSQLAKAKGEVEAIGLAMRAKKCGS